MTSKTERKAGSALKKLGQDTSGMALIYVTVALPVIIGFSLLAIDVGRLTTLQSSLQHGADSLALAGAAELDLRPDAIERSEKAITELILTNESLFATTVVAIDRSQVETCYLSELPADDVTKIDVTDADSDPSDCLPMADATEMEESSPSARFVQILVNPQQFNTIMPASFLGGPTSAASSAEAVAGFSAAVCKFTPVLMCNPFEPDDAVEDADDVYNDYGLFNHIKTEAFRRQLIALKSHDTQWAPGNFGFLEPYAGPGAKELAYSIASVNPQACFKIDDIALKTEPGNIETLKKAFNVRFDLYPNGNIGGESAMSYPPAVNVRKGYVVRKAPNGGGNPNTCNDSNLTDAYNRDTKPDKTIDYTVAMGLPKDSCHYDDSCVDSGGNPSRVGSGDWGGDNPDDTADDPTVPDFYQYWRFNHPGIAIPTETDLGIDVDGDGSLGTSSIPNDGPPSRYAIYRYEIEQDLVADAGNNDSAVNPDMPEVEVGTPQCNADMATDSPDRRIIYGAIINCRANGLDGGKNTGIIAVAFGKFFMTEPMQGDTSSNTVLSTELVDVVQPGDENGVARDIVQLYR